MELSDYVYIGSLSEMGFKVVEKNKLEPIDSTYFKQLNQTNFIKSTVSKSNHNIIDENVRSSKIYKKCPIEVKSTSYECYSTKIDLKKIKPLKNSLECSINYKFDLIKYEEGDHFNEFHYDTFKDGNVATILIFVPSEYTGGDLIFKIGETEHIIKTDEFKETTCVIFGNVLHKCTPITHGIRYVIKGTIKAELPEILSDIKKFKLEQIEDLLLRMEEKSIDYYDKIEKQEQIIKDIIDSYYKRVNIIKILCLQH